MDVVLIRPRESQAPFAAICTAALFALPNVRNVQPGVPPIGAAADVWGFFLNMTLIAVADIAFLFKIMYQYVHKPAAKKN